MVGLKYGATTYLYRKDAQGNVIALINESGVIVARYLYDAWGNVSVVDNNGSLISDANHIGNLNPFRYRGYYYDTETKLYFLKTRYYDPEIGRFMTIDSIAYLLPNVVNGLNLYSYCGNNPVMNIDTNGCSWKSFWRSVGNWFSNAGKTIWNGVKTVATTVWDGITTAATAVGNFFATYGAAIGAGALAILVLAGGIVGSIFTGGLAGAAILGAGIGFFGGVASNMAIQASNNGFANMDFGAAMKSAVIGAFIGAVSGAISFGFGTIGSFYGQMAGNALSNMTIAGLSVGNAFSYLGGASLFSAIGTGAGYLLGSFVGTALGNELMNNLFGYNPSTQENVSEGVAGWIMDGLMKFLGKLFGR